MRHLKLRSLAVLVSVVALLTGGASGAQAAPADSFGVYGDIGLVVGDTVPRSVLEAAMSSAEAPTMPASGLPTSLETTQSAPGSGDPDAIVTIVEVPSSYATVSTWYDRAKRFIRLRQGYWNGTSGFGYTKISNYHNLNVRALQATTRYYTSATLSGTVRTYWAPVNYVVCSSHAPSAP